jgi:hypothetical protein
VPPQMPQVFRLYPSAGNQERISHWNPVPPQVAHCLTIFSSLLHAAASEITVSHLRARDAGAPPHFDDLIAIIERHDRLIAVRPNLFEQL